MPTEIGFLVFPKMQQLDLTGPYEVLALAPDVRIHLIWKSLDPVFSCTGLRFHPTCTLDDCPDLDVLCIPGGGGIGALMEDDEVLSFVKHIAPRSRYVTAVCTGSLLLGAAGLLKGRRATTHWYSHDFLASFGAEPVQGRVVRDGNLITAGGVTSGIDFAFTLLAELLGDIEAEATQLSMEYAPQPPFKSGTPDEARPEVVDINKSRLGHFRTEREELVQRITSQNFK